MAANNIQFDEEKLSEASRAMITMANGEFKAQLNDLAKKLADYKDDNGMMQKAFENCGVFEQNYNNSLYDYIQKMAKMIEEYCGVAIDLKAAANNDKVEGVGKVNVQADIKKVNRGRF